MFITINLYHIIFFVIVIRHNIATLKSKGRDFYDNMGPSINMLTLLFLAVYVRGNMKLSYMEETECMSVTFVCIFFHLF